MRNLTSIKKRLAALEALIPQDEQQGAIRWVDDNGNPIPVGSWTRGMRPEKAQQQLGKACAEYIASHRSFEERLIEVEVQTYADREDKIGEDRRAEIRKEVCARRVADGRALSDHELMVRASKEMNKFDADYSAYRSSSRRPLPDHLKAKKEALYNDMKKWSQKKEVSTEFRCGDAGCSMRKVFDDGSQVTVDGHGHFEDEPEKVPVLGMDGVLVDRKHLPKPKAAETGESQCIIRNYKGPLPENKPQLPSWSTLGKEY